MCQMRRTFATFNLCPSGAIGGCAGILTPPVSRTNTIHEHLGIEGVLAEYSAILVLFQVYQASSLSLGHMNIQAFRDSNRPDVQFARPCFPQDPTHNSRWYGRTADYSFYNCHVVLVANLATERGHVGVLSGGQMFAVGPDQCASPLRILRDTHA